MKTHIVITCVTVLGFFPTTALTQQEHERPYFVTYDHYMEERDALEIANATVVGRDKTINTFWGNWTEFEYGATNWWTTEFYLDAQHTRHEGIVFASQPASTRLTQFCMLSMST